MKANHIFTVFALSSALVCAQGMPPISGHCLAIHPQDKPGVSVELKLPAGYHVTSHQPESEDLIPFVADLEGGGLKIGSAVYPKPILETKANLDYKLSYFSDRLVLKFPMKALPAVWPDLKLNLEYQACKGESCFAPTTQTITIHSHEWAACKGANRTAPSSASVLSSSSSLQDAPSSSALAQEDSTEAVAQANPDTGAVAKMDSGASNSTLVTTEATTTDVSVSVWLGFLLLAFAGGMILNLMPCVLPVLGLKVFALANKRDATRKDLYQGAGAFLLGTLVSFWALAAMMLVLKKLGHGVGWGFQFQEPGFVIFMAIVVVLFALNLFGLFEISLGWRAQTKMNQASQKSGIAGAFFNGAFMTLLATPCTAPMLSPAMGFAFTQPDWAVVLFMTAVAVGLAFPFMAFSLIPGALRFFPKPGAWMMTFKEGMGFLLLMTVPWLVYVLGEQTDATTVGWTLALLVVLVMGVWIYGKLPWTGPMHSALWPKLLTWIGIAVLGAVVYCTAVAPAMQQALNKPTTQSILEDTWSPENVQALNARGIDVFVDYTAAWCNNCKVNEKVALGDARVQKLFAQGNPKLLKADYTKKDPRITADLKRFGRAGVPMYVVFRADGSTEVLPEVLTPQIVLERFPNH